MSDAEIKIGDDRFDLVSAEVFLPIDGVPTYGLRYSGYDPPAQGTAIQVRLASTGFRAAVVNATEIGGTVDIRAVGGNGALSQALGVSVDGKGYISYPAYLPLQELLDEIGVDATDETIAAAESFAIERWQRIGGPAASALSTLGRAAGLGWRVLGDGRLRMAEETWTPYATDGLNIEEDIATLGSLRMSHNFDLCDLAPGMTVHGRRITAVTYLVDSNSIQIRASYRTAGPGTVKEALAGAMGRAGAQLGYSGVYEARVARQNGNGSLDVITGLPSIDGPEGVVAVPLRLGFARARQVLQEGQRVRLRFEGSTLFPGGDPSKPYCEAIEQYQDADRGVVRLNDYSRPRLTITTSSILGATAFLVTPWREGVPRPDLAITVTLGADTAPGSGVPNAQTIETDGPAVTASEEVFLA